MAGVIDNNVDIAHDDSATHVISEKGRTSAFSLTMSWWGVCSALFYIIVGIFMAQAYGTKNAIIGLIITCVSYGIINGILSSYAIKTGLSVGLFSRLVFGKKGAAIATLIFFVTAVYYAVFEGSVMATAITIQFPTVNYYIASLLIAIYSMVLITGSLQHWLDKVNGYLLPLYIIGVIALVIHATLQNPAGYTNDWLHAYEEKPYGWWHTSVYYMGVWVLMMFTFDFARFGKEEDAKYHSIFNFGIPFYLITFLFSALAGIYLVSVVKVEGLSEVAIASVAIGLWGIIGLLFILITQTRINTANCFLAVSNLVVFLKEFGINISKIIGIVIIGVAIYILMNMHFIFTHLLVALAYQGIFIVSWVAIALTFILRSDRDRIYGANPDIDSAKDFELSGILAWVIGSVAGIVVYNLDTMPVLKSFYATITFVVSVAIYYLASKKSVV